jgi:hypothetical protein
MIQITSIDIIKYTKRKMIELHTHDDFFKDFGGDACVEQKVDVKLFCTSYGGLLTWL